MSAARFHAACQPHLWSTDQMPEHAARRGFLGHFREHHGKRPITPDPLIAAARRMWRTPKPKPFDVAPFDRGDWVTWVDSKGEHTGQVWALHTKDTRWVADGTTYHDVHRAQLVAPERSAAA